MAIDAPGDSGSVWAVIVAAGRGARFGSHKQFATLAGREVAAWSIDVAASCCDGVVLVLPPDMAAPEVADSVPVAAPEVAGSVPVAAPEVAGHPSLAAVVPGGATRSASVRAGLAAVPEEAGVIVVHDAARPLSRPELWARVIAAAQAGVDGAVPVVPVTDTVVSLGSDGDMAAVDRAALRAVQTPQAFGARLLRQAHGSGAEATDDATLVAALGGRVVAVDGDPSNLKLTVPGDLAVATALLGAVPL